MGRLYNESRSRASFLWSVEKKALEKMQASKEVLAECKYSPNINEVSEVLASERRQSKKIQDYLYEQAREREDKQKKRRVQKEDVLKQQCSFRPLLNEISGELASSRLRSTTELSREVLKGKLCQPVAPSFTPSINPISRIIVA